MGLAGRKQKQRIPADPRNLSWADDASRFGHSYLSKFGWDPSQGLGSSGDGVKTHLKVQKKLDMMGIGAQHQRDPNGIAWKQNKEFEALLKRLNESAKDEKRVDNEDAEEESGRQREIATCNAFVRAHEQVEKKLENESSVSTRKKKHKDRDHPDTIENTRKKQKHKHQESSSDESAALTVDRASEPPSAVSLSGPRPMAHRVRIRAATRIAGKPASAISEILGIAPSSSVSTPAPTPALALPSTSNPASQPSLSLDNLITSTKTVADYFKEKLIVRSSSFLASSSPSLSGSTTPGLGTGLRPGSSNGPPPDSGEPPRGGIGHQVSAFADGQEMSTEKQRRKAERKAEKRKRRDVKANQATSEVVSTDAKEQITRDNVERKHKKRREREQRQDDDDDIMRL